MFKFDRVRLVSAGLSMACQGLMGLVALTTLPIGHAVKSAGSSLVFEMMPLAAGNQPAGNDARFERPARGIADPNQPSTLPDKPIPPARPALRSPANDTSLQVSAGEDAASDRVEAIDGALASRFQQMLEDHIAQYKRAVDAPARFDRKDVVVTVRFVMDREGHVVDSWVQTSSGIDALDNEALLTLRRAEPLPPIPAALPGRFEILMPLSFNLS